MNAAQIVGLVLGSVALFSIIVGSLIAGAILCLVGKRVFATRTLAGVDRYLGTSVTTYAPAIHNQTIDTTLMDIPTAIPDAPTILPDMLQMMMPPLPPIPIDYMSSMPPPQYTMQR